MLGAKIIKWDYYIIFYYYCQQRHYDDRKCALCTVQCIIKYKVTILYCPMCYLSIGL